MHGVKPGQRTRPAGNHCGPRCKCKQCVEARRLMMTNDRIRELEDFSNNANLTTEEMKEGWHFCDEFDFLLTQGEMFKEDEITCICGFDRRLVR